MISTDFTKEMIHARAITIAVVGDIMLDQYVRGDVNRFAPEANAPVLNNITTTTSLGGAGFVADIISRLGATPLLCGVIGNDAAGIVVRESAHASGIDIDGIVTDSARPTTTKTRYQKNHDLLLRVDDEVTNDITAVTETTIKNTISNAQNLSAIIISDYGKGVVTQSLCGDIIALARAKNIPVLIDPKGSNWDKYRGATVITPNIKELKDVAKYDITANDFITPARAIINQFDLQSLLLTRSEYGIDYITPTDHIHQDSLAKNIITVVGAGDHVIAAAAIGMALQKPMDDILSFASKIAATHIEQGAPNIKSIEPQTDWDIAKHQIAAWQNMGLKVGFTNGCFDILHAGHVMYLNQAKQYCDRLVLGLNSDESVRILKGETRPINNEQDRKDVMMGLKSIDHVVFFGAENAGDDNTPSDVIAYLKPDIFFKGGDYTIDQLPEAKAVLSYGGEVKILGLLDGRSTTNIIAKSQKN